MPVPPPSPIIYPPNPQGPLAPGSGFSGAIGGATAPTGSPSKACGYDIVVPLPGGNSYKEFIKILDVDPGAKCPGNLHEDDTQAGSGIGGSGTGLSGVLNFIGSSSNWAHIGLLAAGAILVVLGVMTFANSKEEDIISTTTGTRA